MTDAAKLDISRQNGVAQVVINNPARRNALSKTLQQDIAAAMATLGSADDVAVIVLSGTGGKAFASGADISEFEQAMHSPEISQAFRRLGDAMMTAVRHCAKPTVAAISGACMGAGVALSSECDLRYAKESAVFGIPAGKLGIGYPVDGVRRLVALMGIGAVEEMFLTARTYTAHEAKTIGLLTDVFPDDEFDARVDDIVTNIAAMAPLALKAARLAVRTAAEPEDETLHRQAQSATDACFTSADLREGWEAFLNKRRPVFRGR